MKSFEIFGNNRCMVLLGKSPEVLGQAIVMNFEEHNYYSASSVSASPSRALLLEYVGCSAAMPLDLIGPLVCAMMATFGGYVSFGVTTSLSEKWNGPRGVNINPNLNHIETYRQVNVSMTDMQLFKFDVAEWTAWLAEQDIEIVV